MEVEFSLWQIGIASLSHHVFFLLPLRVRKGISDPEWTSFHMLGAEGALSIN
jgi:hypothetical protein